MNGKEIRFESHALGRLKDWMERRTINNGERIRIRFVGIYGFVRVNADRCYDYAASRSFILKGANWCCPLKETC